MLRLTFLVGALLLAASCGPTANTTCACVSTAACPTLGQASEDCGIGMVCCPPAADAG